MQIFEATNKLRQESKSVSCERNSQASCSMSRRIRAGRVCACRLCGRPAYTYVLVRLAHQSSNLSSSTSHLLERSTYRRSCFVLRVPESRKTSLWNITSGPSALPPAPFTSLHRRLTMGLYGVPLLHTPSLVFASNRLHLQPSDHAPDFIYLSLYAFV